MIGKGDFQLYRRGRYVWSSIWCMIGEPWFGLQSGGRTESILMSLPRWLNGATPGGRIGTEEAELYERYQSPDPGCQTDVFRNDFQSDFAIDNNTELVMMERFCRAFSSLRITASDTLRRLGTRTCRPPNSRYVCWSKTTSVWQTLFRHFPPVGVAMAVDDRDVE